MEFYWSRYDEMTEEYICRYEDIVAYVYKVYDLSGYAWYVGNKDSFKKGETKGADSCFLAAEKAIEEFINLEE